MTLMFTRAMAPGIEWLKGICLLRLVQGAEAFREEAMARHVPSRFIEKVHQVQALVDERSRETGGSPLEYGLEAVPGVRLVSVRFDGTPLVLSLWTDPVDVAELCGDGSFPATAGALVVHKDDARRLAARGMLLDLSQFVRSQPYPGYYYALFDYVSPLQIRRVLSRLALGFDAGVRAAA